MVTRKKLEIRIETEGQSHERDKETEQGRERYAGRNGQTQRQRNIRVKETEKR